MPDQHLSHAPEAAQRGDAGPPAVTVYTRADCGCCRKALDLLERYAREGRITLEVVGVDAEAGLAARFGASVPVVEVDGKVRFRGLVSPALLERLLRARRPAD